MPEERFNNMHRFLVKICEEAGPLESGSDAEHKAADVVEPEALELVRKLSVEFISLIGEKKEWKRDS